MKKISRIVLLFLLCFAAIKAQSQNAEYNYRRHLQTTADTWQKIILPNEMFGKLSPAMNDLRIYGITKNGDTVAAPYILFNTQAKEDNQDVSFKLINQSRADEGFYYTFETNASATINEIDLTFLLANFDVRAKLEGSEDGKHWFVLLNDYRMVAVKNDYTDYQFTRLLFNDAKYRYFRLFVKSKVDPNFSTASLILHKEQKDSLHTYTPKSWEVVQQKDFKETIIDIDLGIPLPINSIKLFIKDTFDYYRHAHVSYLADSFRIKPQFDPNAKWTLRYKKLGNSILSRLEKNEINFETRVCRKLMVTIKNADNAPLKVQSVTISGIQYYLMARFTQPADYYLLYGNARANKPDYDIEHFVSSIPQNTSAVKVGEEEAISKQAVATQKPLFENKAWLWAIMIAIILLLAGFSFSMLKKVK